VEGVEGGGGGVDHTETGGGGDATNGAEGVEVCANT
jgi:hypothetical protein